jgi:hypothetical protein
MTSCLHQCHWPLKLVNCAGAAPDLNYFAINGSNTLKNGRQNRTLPELSKPHVIIELNQASYGRITQEMVELWKNGGSLHDIARITGQSRARARSALHRNGISTRPNVDESKITAWRKSGRSSAHPPFGFTYYQGKLVMQPREHEILFLIERLANAGLNPNAIADQLNAKELKPRRASKWNRNSVVLVLNRLNKNS